MDIIEMTRELGRALQNDERYIAMVAARQASDEDQALQEAIGEFNLKRMAISNEARRTTATRKPSSGSTPSSVQCIRRSWKTSICSATTMRKTSLTPSCSG